MPDQHPVVPHPPLNEYYDGSTGRVPFVRRIFDDTAQWYDAINDVASLRSGERYRGEALVRNGLTRGMKLLDLASGTGGVARAATSVLDIGDIACLDPSLGMLLAGRERKRLRLTQGPAELIPFRSESFDFLSIGFAMRHFADLAVVFEECRRVLRPGGKILILEITPPRSGLGGFMLRFYMKRVLPAVAAVIGNKDAKKLMRYYWDTVEQCVPPDSILGALREAGFADVKRHVEFGVFSEYSGVR